MCHIIAEEQTLSDASALTLSIYDTTTIFFTGLYVDIWGLEERRMPTETLTLAKDVVPSCWITLAALAPNQHWLSAHTVAG